MPHDPLVIERIPQAQSSRSLDPGIKAVMDRVVDTVNLAVCMGLANSEQANEDPSSIEATARQIARSLPGDKRLAVAAEAQARLAALPIPDFIDLRDRTPLGLQLLRAPEDKAIVMQLRDLVSNTGTFTKIKRFGMDKIVDELKQPNFSPALTKYFQKKGLLGKVVVRETATDDGSGTHMELENGSIYYSAKSGAFEVHGAIREKWRSLGGHAGYLGYPVTDELTVPDQAGRFNHFQGGSIYWTPLTGAYAVHTAIRAEWERQGWELGSLGYPLTDTANVGTSTMFNLFEGGRIDCVNGKTSVVRPFTRIRLRLQHVRCDDETDGAFGTEWGRDEIEIGGVATDADMQHREAPRVALGSYDDGNARTKDIELAAFDLLHPAWWGKTFVYTGLLAEIDSGGFADYCRDLLKKIRELAEKELVKNLTAATTSLVLAGIGAKVGGVFGSSWPLVGTVIGGLIGFAVGYAVGAAFDFLRDLFKDDLFEPFFATIDLPSVHHRWAGRTNSPQWSHTVRGAGGQYTLRGDWVLA